MTAAAISKRIKAKGLGRLRWYCQMCEKQCRDENGFKNHTQSAGHQRQLSLFSENPTDFIERFSDTFQTEFLVVLRRRYGTNMVSANTVYQEYIKDRDHLHMTATKWTTLSDFAKEMGRNGYCRVEDREDGWWMSFVDRSAAEKDRRARDIDRTRVAEEERAEMLLQRQLELAKRVKERQRISEPIEEDEVRTDQGPISVEVAALEKRRKTTAKGEENALASLPIVWAEEVGDGNRDKPAKRKRSRFGDAPKLSALEEIMRAGQAEALLSGREKPGKSSRLPVTGLVLAGRQAPKLGALKSPDKPESQRPWIIEGILVKMINKEVGDGSFHGKKGKILKVLDGYGARVQMIDSKAVLEVDQDDLQTVIPKPGGEVVLLRSPHRGLRAIVKSINIDSFSITATLTESGEQTPNIEYEAVSRVA